MTGFKGKFEHSVDGKGRVPVPAKMRKSLNEEARDSFVATRGLETCIYLYPADEWATIAARMQALNMFDNSARHFVRIISEWAEDVTLDAQGRISLPKGLLEFAGIEPGTKVQINGNFDHIEIWDPAQRARYDAAQDAEYSELAEVVMVPKPLA